MGNISFQGVYSKYRGQWYDFSNKQKEVTPEQVEKDYNSSKIKQALSVDSKDVLLNYFGDNGWVQTDAKDLQVVLTNKDVLDFKKAKRAQTKNKNAILELFNKWYEGLYIFRDITVNKKDKMDI